MERREVVSSNVKWIEYSAEKQELKISFKTNSIYRYDGVPHEIVEGFLTPGVSIGKYFAQKIKGQYPYEKLPPEEEKAQDRQKDAQSSEAQAI